MTRRGVSLWIALIGIALLAGCGTTRRFTVESEPPGALIIQHSQAKLDGSASLATYGETPGAAKILFFGKDPCYVTVEKRGYEPATAELSEGSADLVSLQMKPIPGVSQEAPDQEAARKGPYLLLPIDVTLQMRTGVGAVGHLEPAPGETARLTDELRKAVAERLATDDGRLQAAWPSSPQLLDAWPDVATPLHRILRGLRPALIAYRPRPPLLDEVDSFAEARHLLGPEDTGGRYLLYVWCRSVAETKGRKIGNVLAMLGDAVVQGVNGSYAAVSNPAVFNPSSGTMILFCVVDASTSEVLLIVPYYLSGDLTKEPSIAAVADTIARFPNIE